MPRNRYYIRTLMVVAWATIFAFFLYYAASVVTFTEKQSINVCAWPQIFDPALISAFEKERGVSVNMSYFESNEELLLKLSNADQHGYDLVLPSDYAVQKIRSQGKLKKIDKTKITFYQRLNPLLLGHYFDAHNDYSVPYEWSIFVVGYNTTCFEPDDIVPSWSLIFEKPGVPDQKSIMTNDPYVAVPLAALYLFGSFEKLTQHKINKVKLLLERQKSWVEAYSDFRASYYLASKNACLAVSSSSLIFKAMLEYAHINFVVPDEGTIITIESFAIPQASTKESLVYDFINYMMKPEHVVQSFEKFGFFPATNDEAIKHRMHPSAAALFMATKNEFKRFHLLRLEIFKPLLDEFALQDFWVDVKS